VNLFVGYQADDMTSKFSKFTEAKEAAVDGVTNQMAQLNRVSVSPRKKILIVSYLSFSNNSLVHHYSL
jgi:hypothetical protein